MTSSSSGPLASWKPWRCLLLVLLVVLYMYLYMPVLELDLHVTGSIRCKISVEPHAPCRSLIGRAAACMRLSVGHAGPPRPLPLRCARYELPTRRAHRFGKSMAESVAPTGTTISKNSRLAVARSHAFISGPPPPPSQPPRSETSTIRHLRTLRPRVTNRSSLVSHRASLWWVLTLFFYGPSGNADTRSCPLPVRSRLMPLAGLAIGSIAPLAAIVRRRETPRRRRRRAGTRPRRRVLSIAAPDVDQSQARYVTNPLQS